MKYGTFLRLKQAINAKEEFEKLADLGFNCCHLVFKPEVYTKEDAEIIKNAAQQNGIEISALFAGFKDNFTKWNLYSDFNDAGINSINYGKERIKYLHEAATFCSYVGTKNMLIHGGFVANNPFSEEYKYMVKLVHDLSNYLKNLGVTLLLETGGESPITLKRLIEDADTGNVFVNLDTANLILYGFGNPVDAIFTLRDLIHSMHIKDGTPPTNPKEIGKETEFGEGFVDFKKVFSLLKEYGFKGPYIIEREISDSNTNLKICETLKTVKSYIE